MRLMDGWQQRLDAVALENDLGPRADLPRSPSFYRGKVHFVADVQSAKNLVSLARQRPLSHIGLDTEYRFSRPGFPLNTKTTVHDVRSVVPLLMSVSLSEPQVNHHRLYNFVVDIRRPEVTKEMRDLFHLPVCFVGHNLKVEWFCLWQLGIEPPDQCWDTYVAEKARYLGIDHRSYKQKPKSTGLEEIQAKDASRASELYRMDLVTCCLRHGICYRMSEDKARLRKSFLDHGVDQPFNPSQIDYSAEDAIAAASLYFHQVQAATHQNVLRHLVEIEMPWVTTNARMIWNGLKVDTNLGIKAQKVASVREHEIKSSLANIGLQNINSHPQLIQFFRKLGLLQHFRKKKGFSFDQAMIKANRDRHPAIQQIHELRKVQDWRGMQLLNPGFTGADGRVHPDYFHLGAATGRQTSEKPNVLALSRTQRNLIIPQPGYGIGEVDLSQIEPGIAAVVYWDENLIELFNSGDVYSAMAQTFFVDHLDAKALALPSKAFKSEYGPLRKQMKACTLGILYGLSTHGLAKHLKIEEIEAKTLMGRFKGMFPSLVKYQEIQVSVCQLAGYSTTTTGLRRSRGATGRLNRNERNWAVNHPVQGTAAALFKASGNQLDRLLKPYQAHLLIPLHDSYVFEAPLDVLKPVAELIARILCETIQYHFPQLKPTADINTDHPERWNKDGDNAALDLWITENSET